MPRMIALDLGSSTVRATVWQGIGRKFQFEARDEEAIAVEPGESPTAAQRWMALDGLLARNKKWLQGNPTIAVAWPCESATLHRMTLPFVDRVQIATTLPFAVEAEVPFDLDEMSLNWRILEQTTESKLLVTLVRRQELAAELAALSQRKVDPRYVLLDIEMLAIYAARERVTALVHIGERNSTVALVRDGSVQWARTISVGGDHLTMAIQRALSCSKDEAIRWKFGVGLGEQDGTAVLMAGPMEANWIDTDPKALWDAMPPAAQDAVDSVLGILLAEVRSSLIFAEDMTGYETEEVCLLGSDARIYPIAGYLHADLGIPLRFGVALDGTPIPVGFAVADALALRLVGMGRTDEIDLRTGIMAWKGGTNLGRAIGFGLGLGLVALTLIVLGKSAWDWRSYANQESAAKERVTTAFVTALPEEDPLILQGTGTAAVDILREEMGKMQRKAELMDRQGPPPMLDRLYRLTKAFPPPAEVIVNTSELTMTRDSTALQVETNGYESAAAVETALKASTGFESATKSNERKTKENVIFNINISHIAPDAVAEEG